MALQKITNQEIEEKQIASLPDRMTGTAAENKAAFDALTKAVIEKYNELITVLSSLGGAAEIGSEPFAGVGEAKTVREQLIALQRNIAGAVAGSIPDASITTEKLVDQAITTRKLAANAVTATEIADAEVTKAKIRDLAISTIKLADGAVTEAKLADGAVTEEKIGISLFKAYTGTYTGAGTYGRDNKNILPLSFTPQYIMIQAVNSSTVSSFMHCYAFALNSSDYIRGGHFACTVKSGTGGGTTSDLKPYSKFMDEARTEVRWYSETSADLQMNASGITYTWLAIG